MSGGLQKKSLQPAALWVLIFGYLGYLGQAGLELFSYDLCLGEEKQIVTSAGFGVGAAHVETTKRMDTN